MRSHTTEGRFVPAVSYLLSKVRKSGDLLINHIYEEGGALSYLDLIRVHNPS